MLVLLSGCLYVSTTGSPGELGILYECTYTELGIVKHERICGPNPPDTEYVVTHFHGDSEDSGTIVTCAVQTTFCVFDPKPDP